MEKCKKKRGYVAPSVELNLFVLEAGFAYSLRGDSDGLGRQPESPNSPFGQYQSGENWTNSGWVDGNNL
ncbi:MAG: hypothetical protein J6S82_05165 [Bacteroidales bacterium]|nr:hypothetical protein [Bacteroidales bacterium]